VVVTILVFTLMVVVAFLFVTMVIFTFVVIVAFLLLFVTVFFILMIVVTFLLLFVTMVVFTFVVVVAFLLFFMIMVIFILMIVVTFLLVTVVVVVFLSFVTSFAFVVIAPVIVTARDKIDCVTGGDHLDISVVVTETCDQVISPWLESVRAVDEQIRTKNLALDIRAGLPTVAVLADRNQCLCSRNVASDRIGELPKDEKRRLC